MMVVSFKVLLLIHVVTGAVALLTLFPALLSRKGGRLHRRSGRIFVYCVLVTGSVAVGMALCTLAAPFETHPHLSDPKLIMGFFGWMMLYLATLTVTLAWHGLQSARLKRNHRGHRTPLAIVLQGSTLATALLCAWHGWLFGQPLMIAISGLGIAVGTLNLRYILAQSPPVDEWRVQHMRSLVGAGVSVCTAFFSFGAANLLPAIAFNPVLWAAPTIIGISVIAYHQTRLRGGVGWKRTLERG